MHLHFHLSGHMCGHGHRSHAQAWAQVTRTGMGTGHTHRHGHRSHALVWAQVTRTGLGTGHTYAHTHSCGHGHVRTHVGMGTAKCDPCYKVTRAAKCDLCLPTPLTLPSRSNGTGRPAGCCRCSRAAPLSSSGALHTTALSPRRPPPLCGGKVARARN